MWNNSIPFISSQIADDIVIEYKQTGKLFEDDEFSHKNKAILNLTVRYDTKNEIKEAKKTERNIKWIRAKDWCESNNKTPYFIHNGIKVSDLNQGDIGNCWLIASISEVANKPYLLERVFPKEKSSYLDDDFSGFENDEYCGMFNFRLFDGQNWVDIVIDDYLPFIPDDEDDEDDEKLKLAFLHNEIDQDEFWAPLLEKAFAKLYGSYGQLVDGAYDGGFTELTGVKTIWNKEVNIHELRDIARNFNQVNETNKKQDCIATCGFNREEHGLITDHSYSILAFYEPLEIMQIRNPYGRANEEQRSEWSGKWSDDSKEWQSVDQDLKDKLFENAYDGSFWMSYSDFLKYQDGVGYAIIEI